MGIICNENRTLKINNKNLRNEINELKKIEEENKKMKKVLMKATEGNPKLIAYLEKCNLGIDFSAYKRNIIELINEPKEEIDAIAFYDVIVSIQSIKDIIKGWKIQFNERMKKKEYEKVIKEKVLKIGVIGNSNKGKSFILSKLSKIIIPSGTSIKTEGLSIKYPVLEEFKNRKIVLLDSAGLETPVLAEINEKSEIKDEQEKKENIENIIANKKDHKKDGKILQKNEIKNEMKIKNDRYEIFKEKSTDKVITELFLQNYIIYNSDILIVVVGLLTYSEQKLLNRIKTELKRAKLNKILYIVHNLITYTTIKQVENYIDDILLKSATFELEKQIRIDALPESEIKNGVCYYEINSNPQIFHLIYANEGSEAGKYYNEYTLKFIENSYEKITDLKGFDIVKTIKERFNKISKEIIEKFEDEICFDKSNDIIKLIKPKIIKLKRCYIDELGFGNLRANGFEPYYNYFIKDDKIIIKVEVPGNCDVESSIEPIGEYIFIKLTGNKYKDKEPENLEDNIFNNRDIGKFSLDIPIKPGAFQIKNVDPEYEIKNGLVILSYQLEKKKRIIKFGQDKNNES